ncbi:hypothetical protein [Mesorhizobium sp.]|uniref:hypothetical protein n=1 Tax=Mesorhizobium sp. TaxID=1871066 RepID=UPI000FE8B283|nr:hypothetical protein [Mesorhizobium sp.]RWI89839.1 MAG: hypothetical protein EOR21_24920 [Mesorhizobium sp.]
MIAKGRLQNGSGATQTQTDNASNSLPISSKTSHCSGSRPREKLESASAPEEPEPEILRTAGKDPARGGRIGRQALDDHICAEIADILNARGIRPDGSARRGKADAQFTDLGLIYLVKQYGLRLHYDRLRERGMLTKPEALRKTRNYRIYPWSDGRSTAS